MSHRKTPIHDNIEKFACKSENVPREKAFDLCTRGERKAREVERKGERTKDKLFRGH